MAAKHLGRTFMVLLLAVLLNNVASVPRPQTPRARDINAAGLLIHFP